MAEVKANAAVCEMCGGALKLVDSDNFECQNCGLQYPKDWVRTKIQEITGTVKIEGPVQVAGAVQLESDSLEHMLESANTFWRMGEMDKAETLFIKATESYPGKYRVWWDLARFVTNDFTVFEALEGFTNGPPYVAAKNLYDKAILVASPEEVASIEPVFTQYQQQVETLEVEHQNNLQRLRSEMDVAILDKACEIEKERKTLQQQLGDAYNVERENTNLLNESKVIVNRPLSKSRHVHWPSATASAIMVAGILGGGFIGYVGIAFMDYGFFGKIIGLFILLSGVCLIFMGISAKMENSKHNNAEETLSRALANDHTIKDRIKKLNDNLRDLDQVQNAYNNKAKQAYEAENRRLIK